MSVLPTTTWRPRVLVIDDDRLVRRLYRRTLGVFAEVTEAESGEAGFAIIKGGAVFEAIVADLSMSGMSGVALFRHMSEDFPEMASRFVAITASPVDGIDFAFRRAIGDRLLLKAVAIDEMDPVIVPDDLERVVRAMTRRHMPEGAGECVT